MTDRKLTVWGDKNFTVTIPGDARVTFGPFSPPPSGGYRAGVSGASRGTLRVYYGTKGRTNENVVAVFSGVDGFRDNALDYEESTKVVKPHPTEYVAWATLDINERRELAKMLAEAMMDRTLSEDEEKEEEDVEILPF